MNSPNTKTVSANKSNHGNLSEEWGMIVLLGVRSLSNCTGNQTYDDVCCLCFMDNKQWILPLPPLAKRFITTKMWYWFWYNISNKSRHGEFPFSTAFRGDWGNGSHGSGIHSQKHHLSKGKLDWFGTAMSSIASTCRMSQIQVLPKNTRRLSESIDCWDFREQCGCMMQSNALHEEQRRESKSVSQITTVISPVETAVHPFFSFMQKRFRGWATMIDKFIAGSLEQDLHILAYLCAQLYRYFTLFARLSFERDCTIVNFSWRLLLFRDGMVSTVQIWKGIDWTHQILFPTLEPVNLLHVI